MTNKFQQWYLLTTIHSYFTDYVCRNISLGATSDSARAMKRHGILLRNFSNQFTLHAAYNGDTTFDFSSLAKSMPELYFFVSATDCNFLNYTNLPYAINDQNIYFFQNCSGSANVQQGSFVGQADQIALKSLIFSFPVTSAKTTPLKVTNTQGETVFTASVSTKQALSCLVDLSKCGSGCYTLWLNGKKNMTFFATGESLPQGCLGILRVDLSAIPQQTYQTFSCSLDFQTRSTYWQYEIVIGQDKQIQVDQMSIVNTSGYTYSGPKQQTILNGITASVYISDKPIPLQDKSTAVQQLNMKYKNNFSGRQAEMNYPLPFPDVAVLQQVTNKKQVSFISTKIVNV